MCDPLKRKSAMALGVSLICLLFFLETAFSHRAMPSPASPVVWSLLGVVGAVALALSIYYRWKARSTPE
jgi:hypothetical protein